MYKQELIINVDSLNYVQVENAKFKLKAIMLSINTKC